MGRARAQLLQRLVLEPCEQYVERTRALRRADDDGSIALLHAAAAFADFQDARSAEERQQLAALAMQDGPARRARPFLELAENPALLVAEERLDLAPRRAQRRGDSQTGGVDGDAERAPPAPREAVLDRAAAELDQQSAFCCSSIHASARSLSVLGSRSAASMLGPMRTVTVPARLRNALRGQKRPALCATGTTGTSAAAASHAPPS